LPSTPTNKNNDYKIYLFFSEMKFIFWCAFEHLDFRIPEFEAIADSSGIVLKWIDKNSTFPWIILDLQNENEAKKICSRSISTKFCVELWTGEKTCDNFDNLHEQIKAKVAKIGEKARIFDSETSFKMQIESFMKSLTFEERLGKIETFSYIPTKGPVKLNNPDVTYVAMEFYGLDHNRLTEKPSHLFFGQLVAEGQRDLITK
jgi:tRNA (guanine10-N2)-methyltransferase